MHTCGICVYTGCYIFSLSFSTFFFPRVKRASDWTQSSPRDWLATQQCLGCTFSNPSLSAGVQVHHHPKLLWAPGIKTEACMLLAGTSLAEPPHSPVCFSSVCLRQGLDVLASLNSHLHKAGLTHALILSLPPKCWDYRCVPPCPAEEWSSDDY